MSTARVLRLAALFLSFAKAAFAQEAAAPSDPAASSSPANPSSTGPSRVPPLPPPPELAALTGKPIVRIVLASRGERLMQRVVLQKVRPGQAFSAEVVRLAIRELTDSGRYADVGATVEPLGAGVVLRLTVLPRRIVTRIEINGGPFPPDELAPAGGVRVGEDVTAEDLPRIGSKLRAELVRRGYPESEVDVRVVETDDPLASVLAVDVRPGPPLMLRDRWFGVWPDPDAPGMREALRTYRVKTGQRADEEALDVADQELATLLRARGFHRAEVKHLVEAHPGRTLLRVEVQAGPLIRLVFEGNRSFDADALEAALNLDEGEEHDPAVLTQRVADFYVARGFLDIDIRTEERGEPNTSIHALAFMIREGQQVRVVGREYPCLSAGKKPADVGSEIDSFLSELPGTELIGSVDENAVDALYGPTTGYSRKKPPLSLNPWGVYVEDVYEKAIDHLKDLFRAQGYLSASVGPPALVRRTCDPHSPPGFCKPVGPRTRPRTECRYDAIGLPLPEPEVDPELSCRPDPKRGVTCEPEAVLHLPIKLGPRTQLYDVSFEGNRELVEQALAEAAALEVGDPVSQVELERARRRLLDAYAEEGFAFAEVDVNLDLSADHTHGRARFVISERERVRIARIDLRGARITSESLVRSRIALEVGGLYRRGLARRTEERLGQLGVFSSISVGFEDPYLPAREKVVVVTVEEALPQRLDVRPGFSTGEGFRIRLEYGHRNVAGQAIQLTLSSQLGYLPNGLILEPDVRRKYDELDVGERLERRNTITVEFPEIGLGPLFRLAVDGVDVRDNARDYGLTKDAAIVTLHFRPTRRLSFQVGGSLERNDAAIFGASQKGALEQYIRENPSQRNTFHVPEGTTLAIAQQLRAAWDRRDNPLDATSGTLISIGAEHVHAEPVNAGPGGTEAGGSTSVFAATVSDFMRYDSRVAGYVRLSKRGLALAMSFRFGVIDQLIPDSRTYPDRLFFLGGADSIRGFSQDSLVPEDIAEQLLDPGAGLDINEVVIRGGDAFLNPRAELRIPLTGSIQTALFADAGNLWTHPDLIDPFDLRYSVGSGLRISTPIGPLVFDYGFNVDRVLDGLFPERTRKRTWEALGAFHFSIGVF